MCEDRVFARNLFWDRQLFFLLSWSRWKITSPCTIIKFMPISVTTCCGFKTVLSSHQDLNDFKMSRGFLLFNSKGNKKANSEDFFCTRRRMIAVIIKSIFILLQNCVIKSSKLVSLDFKVRGWKFIGFWLTLPKILNYESFFRTFVVYRNFR